MEDRVADDLPQVEEVIIKEEARDWELEEQQLEDCLSISLESQQRSEDLKNSDEFKKEIQISTPLQGEVGTMDWMTGADGLPDKKPFRACPYCSQKVTCISQLQSHIAECHPGRKRYPCSHCPKNFHFPTSLKNHLRKLRSRNHLSCTFCKKKYITTKSLRKHLQAHHPGQELYPYLVCKRLYQRQSDLDDHSKTHSRTPLSTCTVCRKNFHNKRMFLHHINYHFACRTDTAGSSSKPNQELDNGHIEIDDNTQGIKIKEESLHLTHLDKSETILPSVIADGSQLSRKKLQRKCPYCDEEYNCPDRMETHIACYHPGKKRLPCFHCTKVFRRQIDLQEHSRIHKGEHRLKCPVCNRSFSAAGALRRHVQYFHPSQQLFSCSSCHRVFSQKRYLEEHEKLHQKDAKSTCPVCNQEFTKRDALTRHMATHAVKTPHCCPYCRKGFMFKHYLMQHIRIHSYDSRFTCQICKGTFANMATLKRHKQTHTGIKSHKCCICNKSFRQRCHLVAHILIVHCKDIAHSCSRCGDKFQVPNYLKRHASCYIKGPLKCYECSKLFSHPRALALHIQTHSKEARGRPPKKPKPDSQKRSEDIPALVHDNTQSVSEMVSNSENVTDEGTSESQCFVDGVDGNTKPEERERKPDELHAFELVTSEPKSELGPKIIDSDPEFKEEDFGQTLSIENDQLAPSDSLKASISLNQRKCPYCEEVFDNPSDIESHIVCCHPGQKRHPCFLCVAVFRRQVDLYEHYRTHSGNSRLKCPLCNKSFCSGTTLKAHVVALHPAQKTFSCSICRRVFANQTDADEHRKIHTKESVFKCPVCKRVVSTKENLMRHFASHSVTRPFCCSVCNKGFAYKISLDIHARCHSGNGPYTCSICSKSFTQKGTLNLHQLTHTGEKPHKCSKCGKSFRQRAHLIGHMLVHSGERPYTCNQCGKAFQVRTALRKHAVTHSKRLLDCYNCNSSIAYPDSSIEHIKNQVRTALQKNAVTRSEGLLDCYNFKDGNGDNSVMKSKPNEDREYMTCTEFQSISTTEYENENQVENEISGEMDEMQPNLDLWTPNDLQSEGFLYTKVKEEPHDEEQDEIKPMFNPVLEKGTEGESRASEDVPIEAVCRNLKMEDSLASNVPQPWSDSVPDRKNGVSDGISGDSQHIEEVIVEPNLMNWSPEESCDDDYSNSEFKTEGGSETIPTTILGSESASRLFLALTSSSAPKSLSVANSLDKEPPACASSEYLKNMSNSSEIKEVSLDSIDKDEDYIATSMSVGCELSSDKLQRKCPYCNDEFDCSSRMESHIVYRHPGMKQHVCFQCLRVFRRQIDLIEHFRVHKRESCHQCPVCNRFFSATGTMKRHMKHFHPEQELFTCSFCRRVFCSQSDLDEHKECHQKEIVFNCPVCNDQFDKQESMIQHFEIHSTTQKIFCCVRCNLEFPDNDSLLGHMYTHSTEGLHICEICQKGFTKPASLKLHKLIHTGERPHQCPLCGKGFRQRAHLAGHMLIHSGERPHSCSQCGKTFQVRSKLKKHLVTHASQSRDNYKSSKGSLHSSTPLNYNAHSKGTKADGSGKKPNSNAQPNEETMNRAHDELNTMSAMVRIGEKQEDAEISEDLFHYQSQQTDWKPDELLPDECVSTNFEPEHIEVKVEPRSLSDIDEEMEEESITEDLIDTKEV